MQAVQNYSPDHIPIYTRHIMYPKACLGRSVVLFSENFIAEIFTSQNV